MADLSRRALFATAGLATVGLPPAVPKAGPRTGRSSHFHPVPVFMPPVVVVDHPIVEGWREL